VEDLLASTLDVAFVAAASSLEYSERGAGLRAAAERRGVAWRVAPDAELERLAETDTPQGVLAVARTPRHALQQVPTDGDPSVLLVVDAVQDPGNFGTLVRTAEALGARAVVSLPGTVEAWNPKAVRAAVGSSFRIPIVSADWAEFAPWLREREIAALAAAGDGSPLGAYPPRRAALVVGNEGSGISAESRAHAHAVVAIPLRGRAESLNVTAATAILLHQLLR
jgi:TrmH family RNA methyltransferase